MGYITVSEEIDAYALKDRLWSGAEDTMQRIIDEDKEDDFFAILSDSRSFPKHPSQTVLATQGWASMEVLLGARGLSVITG